MAISRVQRSRETHQTGLRLLLPTISLTALAFLAAPWSLEHKVHMAMHGLCAQRPSHTLVFGGQLLPHDSRMTGIYTGAIVTMLLLGRHGAFRAAKPPTRSRIAVLIGLGAVMALDGFNSLLTDMGTWHPYTTQNWMRLLTGMGAGIVLGFALVFLNATTLWRRVNLSRQTIHSWNVLAGIAAVLAPMAAVLLSGWGVLYAPFALLLLGATIVVLMALSLVIIVILCRREYGFDSIGQLDRMLVASFGSALLFMTVLSLVRTGLDRLTGGSPLT